MVLTQALIGSNPPNQFLHLMIMSPNPICFCLGTLQSNKDGRRKLPKGNSCHLATTPQALQTSFATQRTFCLGGCKERYHHSLPPLTTTAATTITTYHSLPPLPPPSLPTTTVNIAI